MTIEERTKQIRIRSLKNMDFVMRCINDEENGVFDLWLQEGVPDEATEEDFECIAEEYDAYISVCNLFAESIAELLAEGYWGKDGFSRELFNVKAYEEAQDESVGCDCSCSM